MSGLGVGGIREILVLLSGLAALAVGLATRDPATTGIGMALLVATPAAGGKDEGSGR